MLNEVVCENVRVLSSQPSNFLVLELEEKDGTIGSVDLSPYAAMLIKDGIDADQGQSAPTSSSGTPEAKSSTSESTNSSRNVLTMEEEVEVLVEGHPIPSLDAMHYTISGLMVCLRKAIQDR